MASEIPYLLTTKKLSTLFEKIKTAAEPERMTYELLKKLGFTSSNDRAFISLLKKLGFLDQEGRPTELYKDYRHKGGAVLAEGIRYLYSEIFAIHENIQNEDRETIKGAISRVTGREAKYVDLMTSTFEALCELADFNEVEKDTSGPKEKEEVIGEDQNKIDQQLPPKVIKDLNFRYNIEIHLPATTEIAVYNAIFKSMKDYLLD